MTDNGFSKRQQQIANVDVSVQSYKVGTRWAAKVETLDVGNSIGRAMGDSREAAEAAAIEAARMVLELRSASAAFKATTDKLKTRT